MCGVDAVLVFLPCELSDGTIFLTFSGEQFDKSLCQQNIFNVVLSLLERT